MGQGITVTRGYGWVIDKFGGDYAANLEQFIPTDIDGDVFFWLEERMKAEQLDVVPDLFGYDRGAIALLARASTVDSYDWSHELATMLPDAKAEAQYKRELLQALDALEWDEAGLGEPSWLILITYG